MNAISGRVWKFGDNISADNGIIQYSKVPDLGSFDIPALTEMLFVLIDPDFPQKVKSGDIVVAGSNFGHHSHPHACVAMKESGIQACFVESTDSAFVRKALNNGLLIIPVPGVTGIAETGDTVEADLERGELRNSAIGKSVGFRPYLQQMLQVWRLGGLAPALRERIREAGQSGAV